MVFVFFSSKTDGKKKPLADVFSRCAGSKFLKYLKSTRIYIILIEYAVASFNLAFCLHLTKCDLGGEHVPIGATRRP